jgi:glycosyltransferase involved in cell wall biosynthesis
VLRQQLGAEGKFLVCYAGTMGMAHGLEILLDAASPVQAQNPQVIFLLIGEGAEKEQIKSRAQDPRSAKRTLSRPAGARKIPAFNSASDVCLVLLKKTDVFKTIIPTKMLEFMSGSRPVIVGVDGQARQIVEESGGV